MTEESTVLSRALLASDFRGILERAAAGGVVRVDPIPEEELLRIEKRFIDAVEGGIVPEVELPPAHFFFPSMKLYCRAVTIPKGALVISRFHKTSELNLILRGRVLVRADDEIRMVQGPCAFESRANLRKIVFGVEDTVYATAHYNPDGITDPDEMESLLVESSDAFYEHKNRKAILHDPRFSMQIAEELA